MLGAIAGDIIGSPYEWNNTDDRNFEFFQSSRGRGRAFHPQFTDDTVMTLAVAKWLMTDSSHEPSRLRLIMRDMVRSYPGRGFSPMFKQWAGGDSQRPFNSFGNSCAVRVSPIGLSVESLSETISLAKIQAEISHRHPDGIKGAQAIAQAVWMAKHGRSKDDIRFATIHDFGYDLDQNPEDQRKLLQGYEKEPIIINGEETGEYYFRYTGRFNSSCQDTVPAAISVFLQGESFEDVLRRAVSLGGDSDTIAAMAGAIAEPFYGGVPEDIGKACVHYLTSDLKSIMESFEQSCSKEKKQVVKAGDEPGVSDAFRMIRIGDEKTAYIVGKNQTDIIQALKEKFGEHITIVHPNKEKKWLKENAPKEDRVGTYVEKPRVDSRVIFFRDGKFHSPATYPYDNGHTKEERIKAFQEFQKMKEYAENVKHRLQTMSGYFGSGSIHYETAYFPVIYYSKIEVWKGESFAGSIGIDSANGLIRTEIGGDLGPFEWGEDRCFSVFGDVSFPAFCEALSYWCLDEGIGAESKSPFLNIDRANRDIAMSKDPEINLEESHTPALKKV